MKRCIAILLMCCLLLGLLPGVAYGAKTSEQEARVLTKEDYATADVIWEQITKAETELLAKRAPVEDRSEALMALVEASPYYKEGSMTRRGDAFSWKTKDGIPCFYSPALRQKIRKAVPLENYESIKTTEVLSFAKKGGSPAKENVYVIQPYYGLDSSFTEQYNDQAATVAADIGGIATTYRTTDATIDKIADALEDGAVVFFDSHGSTDYEKGDDCVSRANSSYICLQTGTGLTAADYADVQGTYGVYQHALYGGSYGSMQYYFADGTAIANHMDRPAPNSLLWMAICLGMATKGMHEPLRAKGVEVAYGYSQSVTFEYDYDWSDCFWDNMLAGETVANAVADMKEKVGYWDWCHASSYDTLEEARANYSAFPIVVSSEDQYPGKGNVDDYQTVYATWTLFEACEHSKIEYVPACPPTCTVAGNIGYYRCTECSVCFSDANGANQIAQSTTVIPATGHSYDEGVQTVDPSCEEDGVMLYTCAVCGATRTEPLLALGHHYVDGFCTQCGEEEPDAVPFEVGHSGNYVIAAYVNGEYYAMADVFPEANNKINSKVIPVTDGFVSAQDAEGYTVKLEYNSDGTYTIKNDTVYLKYVSGTNLSSTTAPYYWNITEGTRGSWSITSKLTTTRGLFFRAGSYMLFGGYSTANLTSTGDYYCVEILPVSSLVEPGCPHDNVREEVTKEVTCTEDGEITVYCAECGEKLGTAPVLAQGHTFGEGVMTMAPTCETAGVLTYTCTVCNAEKTETIPAPGHSYEDGICTDCGAQEPARERYVLVTDVSNLRAGDRIIIVTADADGGKYYGMMAYDSGNNVKTAEVTPEEGNIYLTSGSAVCSYLLGGEAGAWTFFDGTNYLYTNSTTANRLQAKADLDVYCQWDISVTDGVALVKNVGNTIRGTMQYNSSSRLFACYAGTTQKPVAIYRLADPPAGSACTHEQSTVEITVNPTCEADGEVAYTCVDCGHVWTATIPALGHSYENGTCTNCGDTLAPTVDENLKIYHTLDLASDISVSFVVLESALAEYDSYYLECVLPKYEGNEQTGTTTVEIQPVLKGDRYYFALTGITAVRMGDVVEATLHMTKDGAAYISNVDSYSVATYAYAMLNSSSDSKMLTLCADLLRYGAQAQSFKGYRTDALVDGNMTEAHRAYLSDTEALTFTETDSFLGDLENPAISWVGKTLDLGSKVGMKFVFNTTNYTGDIAKLSMKVTYVGSTGETKTVTLTGAEVYNASRNYYAFTTYDLLASELRTVVDVAVFEGEMQLSETLRYSAETYAAKNTTGALGELCKALFAYSDSAKAFFAK